MATGPTTEPALETRRPTLESATRISRTGSLVPAEPVAVKLRRERHANQSFHLGYVAPRRAECPVGRRGGPAAACGRVASEEKKSRNAPGGVNRGGCGDDASGTVPSIHASSQRRRGRETRPRTGKRRGAAATPRRHLPPLQDWPRRSRRLSARPACGPQTAGLHAPRRRGPRPAVGGGVLSPQQAGGRAVLASREVGGHGRGRERDGFPRQFFHGGRARRRPGAARSARLFAARPRPGRGKPGRYRPGRGKLGRYRPSRRRRAERRFGEAGLRGGTAGGARNA